MKTSRLYLTVQHGPHPEDFSRIRDALFRAFPGNANALYLSQLMKNQISAITTARLGALLLLSSLSQAVGVDTCSLLLARDDRGRPYVTDKTGKRPFDFNLSHSSEEIACALLTGGGRVGIDVEDRVPDDRAKRLMDRFGTPNEREMLPRFSGFGSAWTFFWTVREALGKQEGRGEPLRYDAACPPENVQIWTGYVPGRTSRLTVCVPRDTVFDPQIPDSSLPIMLQKYEKLLL